ncbi:hypothetical protein LCGC14_2337100, partial [marine sediment metagenome]
MFCPVSSLNVVAIPIMILSTCSARPFR